MIQPNEEIFMPIPSFPDYLVSNAGRVKTKSRKLRYTHAVTGNEHFRISEERFLKAHDNGYGYKMYQLYRNKKMYNKTAHQLVAETFIQNPNGFIVVNHIDGNKHNNCVDNLEWCTHEYNHEHATRTGLKAKGEQINSSKLTDNMVHAIKWFLAKGFSHSELSKAFKVSRPAITLIANEVTWKHIILTSNELIIKM